MAVQPKDVIQRFLDRRNELLGTAYAVTGWPDVENRETKAVDAIAESKGHKPLAIEHPLLMTFQEQVREDHCFSNNIVPIENELGHRYRSAASPIGFQLRPGNDRAQGRR